MPKLSFSIVLRQCYRDTVSRAPVSIVCPERILDNNFPFDHCCFFQWWFIELETLVRSHVDMKNLMLKQHNG